MEVDDDIPPCSSYNCGPLNSNETIINVSSTSEDDTDSSTGEHGDELKYSALREIEREYSAYLIQGTTKHTKEPEKSLIVYTTNLERMSFMNKPITSANVSQLIKSINDESKPKLTLTKMKRKRRNKRLLKIFVSKLNKINKILRKNSEEKDELIMNNILSTKRISIQNEFKKYATCLTNVTKIYFRIQHCHSEVSEVYALNLKIPFSYGKYRVQSIKETRKGIVTEYYRMRKEIMFPGLDSRIISVEYCCSHDRDLKLQIFFENVLIRLPIFFKKTHACEVYCTCCCSGYTSAATIIPSQANSKERQNSQTMKYRERISDLINKSSQEDNTSKSIVNRALRFIPKTPLNTKPGVKAAASIVKPVSILLKDRNTKECIFYEVGVNGQMETYIRSYVSEEEVNMPQKTNKPEDTVLVEKEVCWYEKQKLLYKLSLEGVPKRVINFLSGPHHCISNCNCCCESPKKGQDVKVLMNSENNRSVITEEIEVSRSVQTERTVEDPQAILFCDNITPMSSSSIFSASNTIENPFAISSQGLVQITNTATATTSKEVRLPNELLPSSNFNIPSSSNDALIILSSPNDQIMSNFNSQLNTNNDMLAISQCPIQFTNIETIVKESHLPNGFLVFSDVSTPDKANNAPLNHDKFPYVYNVVSNTVNKVIASTSNNDTVHKISSIICSDGTIVSDDILSKFKNIRFGKDMSQNLEIIRTYAVSEEDNKILHHLLKRAQKDIDKLKSTSSLDSSNSKAYQTSDMVGISINEIASRFNGIKFGINKSGYVYNMFSARTRLWSYEEITILECIRKLAQKEIDLIKLNNLPYYTILMDLFNNPQNRVTNSKDSTLAQNQQNKILDNTNKRKQLQDRTYKPRPTYDFSNDGRIVKSDTERKNLFNKFSRNEPMVNNEIYKCFSKWSNVIRTYSSSKIPVKEYVIKSRTIPTTTDISTQTLSSKMRNLKEKEKGTTEKPDEDVIVIDDETDKDIGIERSQEIVNLVINKELTVTNHSLTSIESKSHQNSIKNREHTTMDDFEDFLSSTTILKLKDNPCVDEDRRGRKRRLGEIAEESKHVKDKPKRFNTNSATHSANFQAEQEPPQKLPNISQVSGDSALPVNELSQRTINLINPNPSKSFNSTSPLAKFLSSPVVPPDITERGILIIHDDVDPVL